MSDTASQFELAAGKFFEVGSKSKVDPRTTLGNKFQNVQNNIVPANMEGERYKTSNAAFFGEQAEVRSQGSVFEANKAVFFGGERPHPGFKIQAKAGVT